MSGILLGVLPDGSLGMGRVESSRWPPRPIPDSMVIIQVFTELGEWESGDVQSGIELTEPD